PLRPACGRCSPGNGSTEGGADRYSKHGGIFRLFSTSHKGIERDRRSGGLERAVLNQFVVSSLVSISTRAHDVDGPIPVLSCEVEDASLTLGGRVLLPRLEVASVVFDGDSKRRLERNSHTSPIFVGEIQPPPGDQSKARAPWLPFGLAAKTVLCLRFRLRGSFGAFAKWIRLRIDAEPALAARRIRSHRSGRRLDRGRLLRGCGKSRV